MKPSMVFSVSGAVLAVALAATAPLTLTSGIAPRDVAAACRAAATTQIGLEEAAALCACVAQSHAGLTGGELRALAASYHAAAEGRDGEAAAASAGGLSRGETELLLAYDVEVVSTCAADRGISAVQEVAILDARLAE